MVGSFDRHVQPDEPDRQDRRDTAADRPKAPRETEAQLAERLGLSTLTRAAAYESLYAKAQAQDATFRERPAREDQEKSPESLTDAPSPPIDKPERDPEATRNYWTEVPRFLANWQHHTDEWSGKWYMESNPQGSERHYDVSSERRARAADAVAKLSGAELPISDTIKQAARENPHQGRLAGFEYRTKGRDRLMEKALESLEAQPGATPEEAIGHIPDAIRYTFCFSRDDYTEGFRDVKDRLESRDYEMYYSKNTWSDTDYKGINTRWMTPDGQRFEVQFHTPESFHAKHEVTHQAYERIRDPRTTRTERDELHEFQREVSSWIPVPRRATEIPDYKKEGF
jgi:hypothetical protein